MASFQKVKQLPRMWSNYSSLRTLPRKSESTLPGQDFHPNALSNMDWNSKKTGTLTRVHEWINKPWDIQITKFHQK